MTNKTPTENTETKAPEVDKYSDMEQLRLLNKWKTLLGLEDWNINLNPNASVYDFEVENADGEVLVKESIKSASIKIVDKGAYGHNYYRYFDPERTLVHELLHCKFSLLESTDNEMQNRVVHQLIDDMARTLVAVDRHEAKYNRL